MSFDELEISAGIKRAIAEMGYIRPTPIQSGAIPPIMAGEDVIGHSQTGTGKTAAFGIPALQKIDPYMKGRTQVLVLCPTRELAVQATSEIQKFGKYMPKITAVAIYGGQSITHQFKELRGGAEIIIGTPGRVMDHMRRKTINLDHLSMLVLDEADEMLNMGFRDDIETILKEVPKTRQTVLFSATMSAEIMQITKRYQTNPRLIRIMPKQMTVESINQLYFDAPRGQKQEVLCRLLDFYRPTRAMIFCNTKIMVDELSGYLQQRGYTCEGLHGDMKQASRDLVMQSFKSGRVTLLLATDVAARGIDVEDVDIVFNFDIPQDLEYYIHRIGRTGRAGKTGISITLACGGRQLSELKMIEKLTNSPISYQKIPTKADVDALVHEQVVANVLELMGDEKTKANEKLLDRMINDETGAYGAALALLRMIIEKETRNDNLPEVFEAPRRERVKEHDRSGKRLPASGSKRLRFDVGRSSGVLPNHLMGAIVGETEATARMVGHIEIFDDHSFVGVPAELAEIIAAAMNKCRIKGKKVRCTITEPSGASYSKKPIFGGKRR